MKISIFNGKSDYPKGKEAKVKIAKQVSLPEAFNTLHISSIDDIINVITEHHWSPMVFEHGTRHGDNFISTDFMVVDIDSGMTIEQAVKLCSKMNVITIIAPSTSHTPEHHRFRVVFPLSRTISNEDDYAASWAKIEEYFPAIDVQCKDIARWYIRCREDEIIFIEGAGLLEPIKAVKQIAPKPQNRGKLSSITVDVDQGIESLVAALYGEPRAKVPEAVAYFLENIHTGLSGELYHRGNSFLYTLGLQNCEYDRIIEVFYSLYPYEVTKNVEYQVSRIINEGYDNREKDDI